mmetsp:Transcript_27550/g.80433  ORF Transcript_27550/g.80433 Transcript_27550/m.80433 type:complete len:308 (+) Transcript_27550:7135-8058(+)
MTRSASLRLVDSRFFTSSGPSACNIPLSQSRARSAKGKSSSAANLGWAWFSASRSPMPMSRVRSSLVCMHRSPSSPQSVAIAASSGSSSMSRFSSSNVSTITRLFTTLAATNCLTSSSPSPLNRSRRDPRNSMGTAAKAAPRAEFRSRNWRTSRIPAWWEVTDGTASRFRASSTASSGPMSSPSTSNTSLSLTRPICVSLSGFSARRALSHAVAASETCVRRSRIAVNLASSPRLVPDTSRRWTRFLMILAIRQWMICSLSRSLSAPWSSNTPVSSMLPNRSKPSSTIKAWKTDCQTSFGTSKWSLT